MLGGRGVGMATKRSVASVSHGQSGDLDEIPPRGGRHAWRHGAGGIADGGGGLETDRALAPMAAALAKQAWAGDSGRAAGRPPPAAGHQQGQGRLDAEVAIARGRQERQARRRLPQILAARGNLCLGAAERRTEEHQCYYRRHAAFFAAQLAIRFMRRDTECKISKRLSGTGYCRGSGSPFQKIFDFCLTDRKRLCIIRASRV